MATFQRTQAPMPQQRAGKSTASAPPTAAAVPSEKIAARAYEIWQQSGCPDGKQEEHWYRAERELRERTARSR